MHLNIKICALNDPPAFPELAPCAEAELAGVTILQGGMQSGKTSITFLIKPADGSTTQIVQMSADMFEALAAAVRGARERFGA